MAKRIKVTYYDNYNYDLDMYRKNYQEENELTDEDMSEVSDDNIYDFLNGQLEAEWHYFCDNLEHSENNDTPCVILGTLGLWSGRKTIVPVVCVDLQTAINKCIASNDYVSIKQNCGHLEVNSVHHDGTNTFEIYLLNERGINAHNRLENGDGNANLENKCYHKAIKGYLF